LIVLLTVKILGSLVRRLPAPLRLDRGDRLLVALWGSFFFLLEFFPNGFQFDAYYSVPRIFRYLAPISFPIALHAAKCVLDVTRLRLPSIRSNVVAVGVVVPLLVLYVSQAMQATGPSHTYRAALQAVLHDVQHIDPPALVAESVVASYLRDLYLDPNEQRTRVHILHTEHAATDYERWLEANQSSLPDGTLLITGLASFVHYGAHIDGFRLEWFEHPLSPEWKLVREYGVLSYLPRPEPARLWRLEHPADGRSVIHDVPEDLTALEGVDDPTALFRGGMARFEANDNVGARRYFH
jgi:hypothetical protein